MASHIASSVSHSPDHYDGSNADSLPSVLPGLTIVGSLFGVIRHIYGVLPGCWHGLDSSTHLRSLIKPIVTDDDDEGAKAPLNRHCLRQAALPLRSSPQWDSCWGKGSSPFQRALAWHDPSATAKEMLVWLRAQDFVELEERPWRVPSDS